MDHILRRDWTEKDCMAHLMEVAQSPKVDYVLSEYVSDIFQNGYLFMSLTAGMSEIREGDRRTLVPDFGYVFRMEPAFILH